MSGPRAFTDHALDGWEAATGHLRGCGLQPVIPPEVRAALRHRELCRALWRCGDHELAELLHDLTGIEAA
jgi:hypothetical protein